MFYEEDLTNMSAPQNAPSSGMGKFSGNPQICVRRYSEEFGNWSAWYVDNDGDGKYIPLSEDGGDIGQLCDLKSVTLSPNGPK